MVLFYFDLCSKNLQTPFIRKPLCFPELSWAQQSKTGRPEVLGSASQERLICHLYLKGSRVWRMLTWGREGGILCSSIPAPSHMSALQLFFTSSSLASPVLSISPSLSPTTKCSPTWGTWWLWRVHMKTCQWRYEVLRSVWLFGSLQLRSLLLW